MGWVPDFKTLSEPCKQMCVFLVFRGLVSGWLWGWIFSGLGMDLGSILAYEKSDRFRDSILNGSKMRLPSLMGDSLSEFIGQGLPPGHHKWCPLVSRTGVQYPKGTVTRDWGLVPGL